MTNLSATDEIALYERIKKASFQIKPQASFGRRLRGWDSRIANPSFGCCSRCGISWAVEKKSHSTMAWTNSGMGPLCDQCWTELTPEQRLPHYEATWLLWCGGVWKETLPCDSVGGQRSFEEMKRSVLDGG